MKILFCASYAPSLTNFRWNFIRKLDSLGASILGTAAEEDRQVERRFEEAGYCYSPIALSRSGVGILGDILYFRSLLALMRKESPDLVFCYTMKPVIYGALASRVRRVPRVYAMITGLGYVFTDAVGFRRSLLRRVVGLLMRCSLKACSGVFFQNPDDEAEFRKLGLIPEGLSVFQVAGSGIDLERFPLRLPKFANGRPVQFLLIARMLIDKGICEFVEASSCVGAEFCWATLVGPLDPNPAGLSGTEIEGWVGDGKVRYVPGTDDVRPYLNECDVYVLPSYREGTPRTVLEAMATGRPIITTDAPGCRETVPLTELGKAQKERGEGVLEGENGFLVRVKDVEALAEAMRRFIDDPELIVSMGKRSREIAEEKYDVHKVNEVMINAMGLNERDA